MEEQSGAVVLMKLSAPVLLQFEPVGKWYESRDSHTRILSGGRGSYSCEGGEDSDDGGDVTPFFFDPSEWKDQDHYAVLGLGKQRYRASAADVRKACEGVRVWGGECVKGVPAPDRQKVLQHHPDKQQASQRLEGDDHFKCIKIAYDILFDPKKRRAYDSVDPNFDDSVPPISDEAKQTFFETFGSIFADNARWSLSRKPVPLLGDADSSVDDVGAFYSYWYDFESWREFSYLDEENREKGECRDERRWMEKQNKAARAKRKKEEMARIRTLVDNAYACDPRIKSFKEAEKAEKLAKKLAKEEAVKLEAQQREREQQRRAEAEREERALREGEARAEVARVKREKEASKKALRRERKAFRAACKERGYFVSGTETVAMMEAMERLCNHLPHERLLELSEQMSTLSMEDASRLFHEEVSLLTRQQEEQDARTTAATKGASSHAPSAASEGSDWSAEELQLLVKAVTLHPAGTVRRWETIASFINTHSSSSRDKTAKQVVSKVKRLQRVGAGEREEQNKMAFSRFSQEASKKGGVVEAPPTERYDGAKSWSSDEQKLLEQALRQFPASTADRWEQIAVLVGSRSKAECIARFKELVARVKAKKQTD